MIVEFTYYMNETDHFAGLEDALNNAGIMLTDELYEKIGRPFYEVKLYCTLDIDTGAVEIVGVSQ